MTIEMTELVEYVADEPHGTGCLRTDNGNLPLHKLAARAEINGLVARVEFVQGFRNPYDTALEATYIFPLPDRAAVTAMTMRAADRTVVAELQERAKARDAYDAAIAAGQRASIAEEDRPDVFTMRVGNLAPGEQVEIALTFVGPLPFEDGEATLRIPLVVAPRYIPGRPLAGAAAGDGYASDTDATPDASRITPPVLLPGFPNPIDLSIEVVVDDGGLPLGPAKCSLHNVIVDGNTVRLRPGERVNRDFLLRLPYGDRASAASALVACADATGDEGTFQLTVVPPEPGDHMRGKDVVLVLDRSGSMTGWKMIAARRAAARIVDSLGSTDRFAVLTFDNVIERPDDLPAGLVGATDRNRFRAVEHLSRTTARGGTELLHPLQEALGLLAGEGDRDRVLVLITDGQVGNEDQILGGISSSVPDVRIHAVGIDQAVNAGFLARLASVGGGRCELVESEDRLDEAMAAIHRRIAAPIISQLQLSASGTIDAVSPARLPDVFAGAPVVIRGRYRKSAPALTLTGTGSDGVPWQLSFEPTLVESAVITSLWARAAVRDLEDAYAVAPSDELERTIVSTSLGFGVLCRFTAFVAVDERVVNRDGELHRVVQPVELPAGWEQPPAVRNLAFRAARGQQVSGHVRPQSLTPASAGIGSLAFGGPARRPASASWHLASGTSGNANDALAIARTVATAEAWRLRQPPRSERALRDLLDDLAVRLEALARQLEQDGSEAEPLRAIVRLLRDSAIAPAERAEQAAKALVEYVDGKPAGAFWKRPPRSKS